MTAFPFAYACICQISDTGVAQRSRISASDALLWTVFPVKMWWLSGCGCGGSGRRARLAKVA